MNQEQKQTLLITILVMYRVHAAVAAARAEQGVRMLNDCATMDDAAHTLSNLGVDPWEADDAAYFLTNPNHLTNV